MQREASRASGQHTREIARARARRALTDRALTETKRDPPTPRSGNRDADAEGARTRTHIHTKRDPPTRRQYPADAKRAARATPHALGRVPDLMSMLECENLISLVFKMPTPPARDLGGGALLAGRVGGAPAGRGGGSTSLILSHTGPDTDQTQKRTHAHAQGSLLALFPRLSCIDGCVLAIPRPPTGRDNPSPWGGHV